MYKQKEFDSGNGGGKAERKEKRASNKARGSSRKKTKVTSGDDWEKSTVKFNSNRQVVKQKNKTGNVRTTTKTVYGPDGGRITTKEKQRTNRAGRKAGVPAFKTKVTDLPNFTEVTRSRGKGVKNSRRRTKY